MQQTGNWGKVREKLVGDSIFGGNDYAFRLYDFDIGGYLLKQAHVTFLETYGMPRIREKLSQEPNAPIQIYGICSDTGTDARNETLARERATQLKMFLTRYGGFAFGTIHEKADPKLRLSSDYYDPEEGAEQEYERAVLLRVGTP